MRRRRRYSSGPPSPRNLAPRARPRRRWGRDDRAEDRGRRSDRSLRGALVAAAPWEAKGDALHVARVSVLRDWRGRGLARLLIEACEEEAKLRRIERVTLKTRLELPKNERLFERLGFARRELETHEGFDKPTMVMMEKGLA